MDFPAEPASPRGGGGLNDTFGGLMKKAGVNGMVNAQAMLNHFSWEKGDKNLYITRFQ